MDLARSLRLLTLAVGVAAAGPALAGSSGMGIAGLHALTTTAIYDLTARAAAATTGGEGAVFDVALAGSTQTATPRIDACGAGGNCVGAVDTTGYRIVLRAVPSATNPASRGGSLFAGWSGCPKALTQFDSVAGDFCEIQASSLTGAKSVTAYFKPKPLPPPPPPDPSAVSTITVSPLVATVGGAGTVSLAAGSPQTTPAISLCSTARTGTCVGGAVVSGGDVVLAAQPAAGSLFGGWSGCTATSGTSCTVRPDGTAKKVSAYFKQGTYRLTVKPTAPAGVNGTIAAAPAGGTCAVGSTCTYDYPLGTVVTLTATPGDAASQFSRWTGCTPVTGNPSQCTATMTAAVEASGTFAASSVSLTVSATAGGTVTGTGPAAAINCTSAGGTCTASIPNGASATLVATAGTGYKTAGFSGCSSVSGDTCTLTNVTSPKTVQAVFGQDVCSTCHGNPAPASHLAYGTTQCASCHPGYTPSSANAALHRNGKVDLDHSGVMTETFTTGPQVTAKCLACHPSQATDVLGSVHFTWLGSSTMTGAAGIPQTNLGKRNLVNNFCVAVPSNEARCLQCHPSYSVAPTKDAQGVVQPNTGPMYLWSSNAQVDKTKIDCLICHANLATSNYAKGAAPFGAPTVANQGAGCFPSCTAAQSCINGACVVPTAAEKTAVITAAARNVQKPDRDNCGFCHFIAGGGDNVKMGDLGTALKAAACDTSSPDATCVDVHMGKLGKTCKDCHAAPNHKLKGAGLSIPIDNEGRTDCDACHATHQHANAKYDSHAQFIACQTCHIPRFSQTQYTKVDWDWRTAGDKAACRGLVNCVPFSAATQRGGEAKKEDNHVADPTRTLARGYDWKKGISTYEKNVLPVYRWFDGTGTHAATDNGEFAGEPNVLSSPNGAPGVNGSKIFPFKKMTGRSPGLTDGTAMLVPHVFGNDSLWQSNLLGKPVVPVTEADGTTPWAWSEARIDTIWTGVLNYGAAVGGQLGGPLAKAAVGGMSRGTDNVVTVTPIAPVTFTAGTNVFLIGDEATFPTGVKSVTTVAAGGTSFTYLESQGTTPAAATASTKPVSFFKQLPPWRWVSTEMYINLNHEVQPATKALGCSSCHPTLGGSAATSRMKELYDLGVTCDDPMNCRKLAAQ